MLDNPTDSFSPLCNSCAKIACCSSELIFRFLYMNSSIQISTSNSPFAFCWLRSLTKPTNKNLTELGLQIQTVPSRLLFWVRHTLIWTFSLSKQQIVSPPKILNCPRDSPCISITQIRIKCHAKLEQFFFCGHKRNGSIFLQISWSHHTDVSFRLQKLP